MSRFLYGIVLLLLVFIVGCTGQEEVRTLFADSFEPGATGAWILEGDGDGRFYIQNKRLLLELDRVKTMQYSRLSQPIFRDFIYEVDATLLGGDPSNSYGVLTRIQNADQFYRFEITGTGLFLIEKNENGKWVRLTPDWAFSPVIYTGINVTNRLRVEAAGNQFSFYINDQLVQQVQDGSYSWGGIGVDGGTFGTAGLRVSFDNILVREIK